MDNLWDKNKILELMVESQSDDNEMDDNTAFDVADGILFMNKGLEESIKFHFKVEDAKAWIADQI